VIIKLESTKVLSCRYAFPSCDIDIIFQANTDEDQLKLASSPGVLWGIAYSMSPRRLWQAPVKSERENNLGMCRPKVAGRLQQS